MSRRASFRYAMTLGFVLFFLSGVWTPLAFQQERAAPSTHLKVGDPAPDFTLPDQNNRPVRLSDFRGKKNVVLAFYVLAFTGG